MIHEPGLLDGLERRNISAAPGNDRLTITVPVVATNADGSAITGPSYEYLVFDNATIVDS